MVVGTIFALVMPHDWPLVARILVGWTVFCAVNLARLLPLLKMSPEKTAAFATREDETRALAAVITTVSALISLVGAFLALHEAGHSKGLEVYLLTALAVLTVGLSWLLVQAEYTLHYAYRYYTDDKSGVQFLQHGSDKPMTDPAFIEFAYLSLTIGMTYQVSDTSLDTTKMRRLLLEHAVLSYLFSVVIIAVTINAVAGLVG